MDPRRLNEKASQETFISLLQLDPTPMESSPNPDTKPDVDKDLPPLPEHQSEDSFKPQDATGSSTTSIGLSGSGRVIQVQRYSSYTLSIFTTLHLVTTSLIPLATHSVPASESYLLLAREIYQTPLSEPLLIGLPTVAHLASGLALRLIRRAQNLRRYGGATPGVYARGRTSPARAWPPLSYVSLSGYAFTGLFAAHVFVNRALPLAVEGDSSNIGLAYVAHGFARHPFSAWLAYTSLLAVGCGHMVWGCAKWLGFAQRASWRPTPPTGNAELDKRARKRRRLTWLAIHGMAVTFASLWAAGGLAIVARGGPQFGWVGKIYDGLFDSVPGV